MDEDLEGNYCLVQFRLNKAFDKRYWPGSVDYRLFMLWYKFRLEFDNKILCIVSNND